MSVVSGSCDYVVLPARSFYLFRLWRCCRIFWLVKEEWGQNDSGAAHSGAAIQALRH